MENSELFDSSISSFDEAMDEALSIFEGRETIHGSVHASWHPGIVDIALNPSEQTELLQALRKVCQECCNL
jgi:hypothetical protein